jgi:hypothetical protein
MIELLKWMRQDAKVRSALQSMRLSDSSQESRAKAALDEVIR